MSDGPSRLPDRPSLQQLRKQAKERLLTLRSANPAATLSDAQFALAREYGFESWPRLVAHVERTWPTGLSRYEQLANDVADAYRAADVTAIREINWRLNTSFVWFHEPERMHERLPAWWASETRDPQLAIADARRVVARQYGFESWAALVESLPGSTKRGPRATTPPVETAFYRVDTRTGVVEARGPLTDDGWDTIFAVMEEHGLTGLNAGGQMSDGVMQRLARRDFASRIETLDLSGWRSTVTDRGLEALQHFTRLRRFELCWPQLVSDAGVAHLAACDHLEYVNLMGTNTGDGVIRALAGKRNLRDFKMGRQTTDAGLALLRAFPAFTTRPEGGIKYGLMSFQSEPTFLLVDGPVTGAGLASLASLDGLTGMNFFWHVSALTPADLAPLAEFAHLVHLGCQGALCNDETMQYIAAMPNLRMLMAQGTVATDDGFSTLSRSRTIEHIWGRECPNLGSRGFAALATMPTLRGLAVSCRQVDDAALALLPAFPALRELMPMDVTDNGFRHVGACTNLETLSCMYCRSTGDAATEHIAGLSRLKHYYAGATLITDRSLELLARIESLEKLTFWSIAGITDAGVAPLATLPRLRELTVENSPNVTRAISEAFPADVRVTFVG